MKGLKTQESEKFNKFWNIVQAKAVSQGKVFFADCGEGRDFMFGDIEGEDMRGWLIDKDEVTEFQPEWEKGHVSDRWIDNIYWAEWKIQNGIVTVEFNTY